VTAPRTYRELAVDRAIYAVDDATRTYRFLRRNPEWRSLDPATSRRNKASLHGYTRSFRSGRARTFDWTRYEVDR
jgi:hypothetical protein